MRTYEATYGSKTIKVRQISPSKAIRTAAKIFGVKPNKVSVRQV